MKIRQIVTDNQLTRLTCLLWIEVLQVAVHETVASKAFGSACGEQMASSWPKHMTEQNHLTNEQRAKEEGDQTPTYPTHLEISVSLIS